MSGQRALIELRGLSKAFKTPAGSVTVLKRINLDFHAGEFVGIVGKSGSGKSTLVNMITGIDHPTQGSVQVEGRSLHTLREGELAVWRGQNMGVVFQFFQLLPMLTVLENVLLPLDLAGITPFDEREARAMHLLERVGAGEIADKLPGALSGGQQQTAAIARALANDPPILIADEPTGNLDSLTARGIIAIFEELAREGKTILMVTHDMSLAKRANRLVILSDGEVVNETLAAALPGLTHPQLLELSHLAQERALASGEELRGDDAPPAGLLAVIQGELALPPGVTGAGGRKPGRLAAAEYLFMENPLEEESSRIVAGTESGEGARVVLIEGQPFARWLEANPAARRLLAENAVNRPKLEDKKGKRA